MRFYPMSLSPPIVLSFAATDPSGGAGLQADVLTLSSMGCHPLSVVTAVTVQDTAGIEGVLPLDPDWVSDQARSVLEDIPVDAFKVGAVGSLEVMTAVAEVVADYPDIPLILDAALGSGRGEEFSREEMISGLRELLIPQATLVTANSTEARRLAEEAEDEALDAQQCALRLIELGCEYVLITGTHDASAQVVNTLYSEDGVVRTDTWDRLPGNFHGSGTTLAAAIAATLANGLSLPEAVKEAQEYTWQSLKHGFRPGMGRLVPDRMFWAREDERDGGED
ncbi:MAG TPA: hydroxymethylpyrimidine/phosphomethylpyrimidine kinase [Burkholderiales bacterium]|nr:hydroxymethylpyrimidine/phosphomethylpyrimidine kinase [Burkholderiales bacterium]